MNKEQLVASFDGTRLYTRVYDNDGPTVVLCDGLGCSGFIWRYVEPYLAARFKVIHWHYRGHGFSQQPKGPRGALGVDDLCGDLKAVLDAHQVDRAVLAGHSMGAQVILQFAHNHPKRVAGLVPICGSYGRPLDTFHDNGLLGMAFPYIRDIVLKLRDPSLLVWRTVLRSELVFRLALNLEVNRSMLRPDDFRPYFEHLAAIDPDVFVRLLDELRVHTVEEHLPSIKAPTLIIAGDRDTFTPVWLSRRMEHLMPNAELLVVRGGTHVTPLESPELVELRLERFLDTRAKAEPNAQPRAPASRQPRQRKRA